MFTAPPGGCHRRTGPAGPRVARWGKNQQLRWGGASVPRGGGARWGVTTAQLGGRTCLLYDLSDVLTPYTDAWSLQKELVAERTKGAGTGAVPDAVLLVQHPPVYTLGSGSTLDNVKFDPANPPIPLHRTERGGEVTYHGPGQLVLYPILDLRANHKPDLHWHMRMLEETVIRALEYALELQGGRVEGLTGVWTEAGKVAALGVRANKWVTYHGVALNVVPDLAPFGDIVPCGITDRAVASVEALLSPQQEVALLELAAGWPEEGAGKRRLASTRGGVDQDWSPLQVALLDLLRGELLGAFEEVYNLELCVVDEN